MPVRQATPVQSGNPRLEPRNGLGSLIYVEVRRDLDAAIGSHVAHDEDTGNRSEHRKRGDKHEVIRRLLLARLRASVSIESKLSFFGVEQIDPEAEKELND